jgi:hypothetical protein
MHGCTINDLLMTVFTTQVQAYENKAKALSHKSKDTSVKPEEPA